MLKNVFHGVRAEAVSRGSNVRIEGKCHKVRGVTKTLQSVLYPHYKVKKTGRGNSSAKIGSRVHKEVENWVDGIETEKPHRYTKQIQAALKERKLEPIAAEAPLLSVHGAYLTYADMICSHKRKLDSKQEVVVVSLKTGYSDGMMRHQGYCKSPCEMLKNCSAIHHMLQLACEVYTLKYEYGIAVARAIVLYVGYGKRRKTRALALPQWGYSKSFMGKVHRQMAVGAPIKSSVLKKAVTVAEVNDAV